MEICLGELKTGQTSENTVQKNENMLQNSESTVHKSENMYGKVKKREKSENMLWKSENTCYGIVKIK